MSERAETGVRRAGRIAGHVLDRVEDAFAVLAAVLLVVGIATVLLEITARYFFGVSYAWVIEINEDILVYLPFLGAAWVLRKGGHVTIDLLETLLPAAVKRGADVAIAAVGAGGSAILVWFGTALSWDAYAQGRVSLTVTQIPEVYVLPAIPIGGALLVAEFVRQGIRALAGKQPVPDVEPGTVIEGE